MGSVNRVILVGNLGKDAELRYTPGGSAVSTFSMATTEVFKDKEGQRKEQTEWHTVVLWGKQAETLNQYLIKGKQVYVEGRLQTRSWEDKNTEPGQKPMKHYKTEVKADRIVLLGGGSGQRAAGGSRGTEQGEPAEVASHPVDVTDDDIPF